MCGIVGAVAQRDVAEILVDGLHRLEYRGYDSAGVAVLGNDHNLQIVRRVGKVKFLDEALESNPLLGGTGIAHTVGQHTVSHQKLMLTHTVQAKLPSFITVLSRTTKNCALNYNNVVMYSNHKRILK